jgi:tRNA-dihydrouridine synthase
MINETGCGGIVVGRACLGRPWFFADLDAEFRGQSRPQPPDVGTVASTISEHARLLAEHQSPHHAVLAIRKHIAWYLTGYPVGGAIRRRLVESQSLAELDDRLAELDPSITLPEAEGDRVRGTHRGPYPITLPQGWMSRDADAAPQHADAELVLSGG